MTITRRAATRLDWRRPFAEPRRVRWWGIAAFTLLGCVWALSSPLMSVPDEPAHTIRAVSIADGQLRGQDSLADPNGFRARVVNQVQVAKVYAGLDQLPACHQFNSFATADCAPPLGNDRTPTLTPTAAGAYPPTYYVLVGWPSRFLDATAAIYAMRLVGAVLCGILLGWGLGAAAGMGTSRVAVLGVGLATTPMVLFIAGSINPNGLEVAAALCTWVGLLEVFSRADRPATGQLVRLAVAVSLLTLARPLGPLFTVGIVLAVLVFAATRPRLSLLLRDRRVWALVAVMVITGGLAALWTIKAGVSDSLSAAPHGPVNGAWDAATTSLGQTEYRIRQMIGYFGWLDSPPPFLLEWLWLGAIAFVSGWALVVGTMRQRLGLLALAAATVAMPVAFETQSAEKLGYFWQGRYTLAVGIGVPILATWIVALRVRTSLLTRVAGIVLGVGVVVGQAAGWATMMTRYDKGGTSPLLSFLHRGSSWRAPGGTVGLTIAFLVGAVLLGIVLVAASTIAPSSDAGAVAGDDADRDPQPAPAVPSLLPTD